MSFDRIFLVGFMCSGKSTVGKLLAKRLEWEFLDMDDILEEREGKSISQIFEDRGEEYFRGKEFELLKELSQKEKVIISTGGGLGANQEAMKFMKSSGLVIWIYVSFDGFLRRCASERGRPLLSKGVEFLRDLFEKRKEVYALAYTQVNGELALNEIVEKILDALPKGHFKISNEK